MKKNFMMILDIWIRADGRESLDQINRYFFAQDVLACKMKSTVFIFVCQRAIWAMMIKVFQSVLVGVRPRVLRFED